MHHAFTVLDSAGVTAIKIIVYDFTKGFDKFSYNIILKKLQDSQFPPAFVKWIENYLKDRVQATRIGYRLSTPTNFLSGVLQGSILGPMLFCFVVGSLKPLNESTKIVQYIDHTTLCIPLCKNDKNLHVSEEHSNLLC